MAVLPTGIGPVTGGYQIERSLRFNSADTAYLNRTLTTPTNNKIWTWSSWVKKSFVTSDKYLVTANGTTAYEFIKLSNSSSDNFEYAYWNGSAFAYQIRSTLVLRDPSAWYHIVVSVDTTQATAANRVKLYVNNVEITSFSISSYPAQNTNTQINSAIATRIGGGFAGNYFDGYMTEVNFIDGQALTPSSFGETDSNTGVWKPKAYSGTYGTNGFYLPFKIASNWSGDFDGTGDFLNIAAGNTLLNLGTGDFTVEFWMYGRSVSTGCSLVDNRSPDTANQGFQIGLNASTPWFTTAGTAYITAGTTIANNTWYHIALTRSGNSFKLFLNGTQTGSTYTGSSTQNFTNTNWRIGSGAAGAFNGYLSNVRIIKGTALYTSNFTAPAAQLTAVSGTSLLTCQSSTFIDNSGNSISITTNGDSRPQQFSPFTLDVTDDHSGQGNHWQPNNLDLRTTGAGADILVDTPTAYGTDTGIGGEVRGNYCTMNPLDSKNGTASNGNLLWTATASQSDIRGTFAIPASGKWYMECTVGSTTNASSAVSFGLATSSVALDASNAVTGLYQLYASSSGFLSLNGTNVSSSLGAWTAGDVLQIAVDVDNTKMWLGKNNTWYNSSGGTTGNPSTGANATSTTSMVGLFPFSNCYQNNATWNAGQRAFAYTAPSGFKALCTQNLPTPTIGATSTTQANDYFNAVLYSGNSSTQAITGVGFQPDFVWCKARSTAAHHIVTDAVRTAAKVLSTSQTAAESAWADNTFFQSLNSDGFTLTGGGTGINTTGNTYVAWNWKANGAGSSNTAGSITSTVSANTTSGFSIVTYTGTGANATVGHGLGIAPSMVIVKGRSGSGSGNSWRVYHSGANASPASGALYLNSTSAFTTDATAWNSTAPTSTVFSLGTDAGVNSTGTYVAYCFAPVAGYSAFGKYTGNGSTDGPFVYTGFRPRYLLIKKTSAAQDWYVYDTARDSYNEATKTLFPNGSFAEESTRPMDFLSNGFKLRVASNTNDSGATYIYAAFAESPFKFSLAR